MGCQMGPTACCGAGASHCSGPSCCRARALGSQASVVTARRLSSSGLQALECGLSSGTQASLLHSTQDLLGREIKPMSSALAGRFFTTGPPRKSYIGLWDRRLYIKRCREFANSWSLSAKWWGMVTPYEFKKECCLLRSCLGARRMTEQVFLPRQRFGGCVRQINNAQ